MTYQLSKEITKEHLDAMLEHIEKQHPDGGVISLQEIRENLGTFLDNLTMSIVLAKHYKRLLEDAQKFKEYVHQRLDEAGVPTHPRGRHSEAGCRVGDRLDIALHTPIPKAREFHTGGYMGKCHECGNPMEGIDKRQPWCKACVDKWNTEMNL